MKWSPPLLLIIFVIFSTSAFSQEIPKDPIDCVDDLLPDPGYCPKIRELCNSDPRFSVCSVCIFPGQDENCEDYVDNNCNVDEEKTFDGLPSTGVDAKDISCCDVTNMYWADTSGKNINGEKIPEGTPVQMVVEGTSACEGKIVTLNLFESDFFKIETPPFVNTFSTKFSGTTAKKSWITRYYDADILSDDDYVFNVSLENIASDKKLPEIQVFESPYCVFFDSYWNPNKSIYDPTTGKGSSVGLITEGSKYCKNNQTSLEIWEEDNNGPDDHPPKFNIPQPNPNIITFSQDLASTSHEIIYDESNDDNDNCPTNERECNDLQYHFTSKRILEDPKDDNDQELNSDELTLRYCMTQEDEDCDKVCNPGVSTPIICEGTDICPNTPYFEEVDNDGCSNGQSTCLIHWECPEWSECDDDGYSYREIGDCSYEGYQAGNCKCKLTSQETLCAGSGIHLPTQISCIDERIFPFFTTLNVIAVIIILGIIYFFKIRKDIRRKSKPFKRKKKIYKKRKS